MRIKIKTLGSKTLQIECQVNSQICHLKEIISETQGWETFRQKLVFKGKQLDELVFIDQLNLLPTDFLVVVLLSVNSKETKLQIDH